MWLWAVGVVWLGAVLLCFARLVRAVVFFVAGIFAFVFPIIANVLDLS